MKLRSRPDHVSRPPTRLDPRATALAPVLALALALAQPVAAAVPDTVLVAGLLTSQAGGAVTDGGYAMTFSLYADAKAAKATWSEAAGGIQVVAGRFTHALGSVVALPPGMLAGLASAHLGVRIGADPELPRVPLRSVAYALAARSASSLSCSGCVKAAQLAPSSVLAGAVAFTYAASKTKGGPATDLACTGCVAVAEMQFDADVDLGGNGLKAKKLTAAEVSAGLVAAASFVGDGSKLTGIKTPSGACKGKDEVVQGIAADGSLKCIKVQAGLPPDGLVLVSNGLLTNQFVDVVTGSGLPVPISDNNPVGSSHVIKVPDVGIAQGLKVSVKISNSDISTIQVTLFGPDNKPIVLYDKGGKGKLLQGTWPAPDKVLSGDLGAWVGKNAKGLWRLRVVDGQKTTGDKDGAIEAWSVSIHTLSDKKVEAKGLLIASGGVDFKSTLARNFRFDLANTAPVKCDAAHTGYTYVDEKLKQLRFCTGLTWAPLLGFGLGQTAATAGKSCADLYAKGATKDGVYWINPKGKALQTWCMHTLSGTGWSMIYKYTVGAKISDPQNEVKTEINAGQPSMLGPNKAPGLVSLGLIDFPGATKLMAVVYKGGKAVYKVGFSLVSGNLDATWKKNRWQPDLSSVNLSSYEAGLISLGSTSTRKFYVTHNHGGCGNDAGSLVLNPANGTGCSWEKPNTIHYWAGPGDWANYTTKIHKDGEVLALYVR